MGLVASLSHPSGNITAINFVAGEVVGKRIELLRALLPSARRIAILSIQAALEMNKPTDVDANMLPSAKLTPVIHAGGRGGAWGTGGLRLHSSTHRIGVEIPPAVRAGADRNNANDRSHLVDFAR